jgi:CPA2 family monovalent cation:H+ antiporter-2
MVIVVPALANARLDAFEVLLAVLKGILLIGLAYILSMRVLPGIWRRIVFARSRELSLLAALTLAVGLATGSALLGLSIAFGAFLAGLAVSESEYGYTTLVDIVPFRDVFASVFFISVGMLIEPETAWEQGGTVLVLVAVIVLGKGVLSAVALRLAGLALAQAILGGLLLAQVGEFSFVIARASLSEGIISDALASAFLTAGVLTILLTPVMAWLGPPLLTAARRLPLLGGALVEPIGTVAPESSAVLRRHVVICGYGSSAAALVRSLSGRDVPFVVIDNSPFLYEDIRRERPDFVFVYGDATRPEVLELAGIRDARILAVTLPSASEARVAVAQALRLNPNLDVVSRGSGGGKLVMRAAGSSEVVDPEFEASLEFVRHVLHRYGVDGREIAALQARWRFEHYAVEGTSR